VLLVGRLGYLLGGAAVMRTTVALAAALALGIFTVPVAGDAQQATKLRRVGHLGYAYPTAANDLEAFRHRLRDLGYVEGKNLVIESRSAESGSSDCLSWRPSSSVSGGRHRGVPQQDGHDAEAGDADDILAAGGGR
jgi:hypothetical protein